ncbi:hypothetical protein F2Q68_00045023 [Brassica cretica]|uniref:Uncharacterized protein n=2 Tax=Brassica TaxID=3705 RepID=A0A8S9LKV8_BRACR|nr:hypothetical protein F2Q68_00045023 [Brassica cretica]
MFGSYLTFTTTAVFTKNLNMFGSYLAFTTTAVFTYLLILLLHIVSRNWCCIKGSKLIITSAAKYSDEDEKKKTLTRNRETKKQKGIVSAKKSTELKKKDLNLVTSALRFYRTLPRDMIRTKLISLHLFAHFAASHCVSKLVIPIPCRYQMYEEIPVRQATHRSCCIKGSKLIITSAAKYSDEDEKKKTLTRNRETKKQKGIVSAKKSTELKKKDLNLVTSALSCYRTLPRDMIRTKLISGDKLLDVHQVILVAGDDRTVRSQSLDEAKQLALRVCVGVCCVFIFPEFFFIRLEAELPMPCSKMIRGLGLLFWSFGTAVRVLGLPESAFRVNVSVDLGFLLLGLFEAFRVVGRWVRRHLSPPVRGFDLGSREVIDFFYRFVHRGLMAVWLSSFCDSMSATSSRMVGSLPSGQDVDLKRQCVICLSFGDGDLFLLCSSMCMSCQWCDQVFGSSGGTCPRLVLSLEACSVCSSLALLVLGRRADHRANQFLPGYDSWFHCGFSFCGKRVVSTRRGQW